MTSKPTTHPPITCEYRGEWRNGKPVPPRSLKFNDRLLAVVDIEDREQVTRLADLFERTHCARPVVDRTRDALRDFAANSPKPDEPTDPAARVVANGLKWARVGSWWVTPATDVPSCKWHALVEYDDLYVYPEGDS